MAAVLRLSAGASPRLGSLGRRTRPRPSFARSLAADAPVAASTSSFVDTVVAPVQAGLLALHESSGLPWWATLGLTAVGVRTAFLPVVYYQV